MKQILLANVGNRNLTYKGESLHSQTFRERTKELLYEYEAIKDDIKEQILRIFLDEDENEIERIVLFASDNQNANDRNNQDTLYAAQILQKYFENHYNLKTDIIYFTKNITDYEALFAFYLRELRAFISTSYFIIICDAGGTAQQKTALKITADFVLLQTAFSIYAVHDTGKKFLVTQTAYRQIIEIEQLLSLLRRGEFSAALSIYERYKTSDVSSAYSDAHSLLCCLSKRADLLWHDVPDTIRESLSYKHPILNSLKKKEALGGFTDEPTLLKHQEWILLVEQLELSHYRYTLGDYTRAIVGLQVFIEIFIKLLIDEKIEIFAGKRLNFRLSNPYTYEKACRELIEYIEKIDHFQKPVVDFFKTTLRKSGLQKGVPLFLKIGQAVTTGDSKQLIDLFVSANSVLRTDKKGIDILRNNTVHNGKSIDYSTLINHVPDIDDLFKKTRRLVGLSDMNTYVQLLSLAEQLIREAKE